MIDLHEGIAEIFLDAQRDDKTIDWAGEVKTGNLSFDSETARSFAHEANYIAECRLAPGVKRWRCPQCGEEVELRPGSPIVVHVGPFDQLRDTGCPRYVRTAPRSLEAKQEVRRLASREYQRRKRAAEKAARSIEETRHEKCA